VTKALDTNIVVRLFVDDGSKEVPIARKVFEREQIEIPLTVILECEWVLRSVYKFKTPAICDALDALLGLRNVTVQQEDRVVDAVGALRLGVPFADAIHLLTTEKADELLTFDDRFKRRAARIAHAVPVRIPTLNS
jgi:predicted nucleic-acid-binding protein